MIRLKNYETILLSREEAVATITLHRPEVRNAINLQMIREITSAVHQLNSESTVRLILFTSSGDQFCSGADIKWMKAGLDLPEHKLKSESLELAGLFRTIRESAAITISSVKGLVPGGAIGLLAASDFVVAERSAVLRFSELNLGLIPATIAPYVLRKAGYGRTSDWMMTGRPIDAMEAREAGLIQRICEEGSLEACTGELTKELLSKGPHALEGLKQFLRQLEDFKDPDELDAYTSGLIAEFRVSREGQEGMKAFFEKRKPDWDGGK